MIAANNDAIITVVSHSPLSPVKWRRNSDHAISATAPPPTPLNSATICGIAVIFTLRAAGTPTAVPTATPNAIRIAVSVSGITPGFNSVATTAIAIPTAAILLPRTAVCGPVRPRNPTMNRITATMYSASMKFGSCRNERAETRSLRPASARPRPASAGAGFLLNIPNIRSVTRNPPTTLIVPKMIAITKMTLLERVAGLHRLASNEQPAERRRSRESRSSPTSAACAACSGPWR